MLKTWRALFVFTWGLEIPFRLAHSIYCKAS